MKNRELFLFITIAALSVVAVGCGAEIDSDLQHEAGRTHFAYCSNDKTDASALSIRGASALSENEFDESSADESDWKVAALSRSLDVELTPWANGVDIILPVNDAGQVSYDCNLVLDGVRLGELQQWTGGKGYPIRWCDPGYEEHCPYQGWVLEQYGSPLEPEAPDEPTDDTDPPVGPLPPGYTVADFDIDLASNATLLCWQGDDDGVDEDGEVPHAFGPNAECESGEWVLSKAYTHFNVAYDLTWSGTNPTASRWEINTGIQADFDTATPFEITVGNVTCDVMQYDFRAANIGVAGYHGAFKVTGTDTDGDGEFDKDVEFLNLAGDVVCD